MGKRRQSNGKGRQPTSEVRQAMPEPKGRNGSRSSAFVAASAVAPALPGRMPRANGSPLKAALRSLRSDPARSSFGWGGLRRLLPALSLPSGLLATRRRQMLALILTLLVVLLAAVLGAGAGYLLFGAGTEASVLPPLVFPGQQPVPRFVFAIDGISRPLGVAVAPAGDRIYVTESDGERQLKIFDRDGKLLRAVSPPGTEVAGRVPVYVAVHPAGKVYVTDRIRGVVDVYSLDGYYEGELLPPAEVGKPWAPLAIAVSPDGDLAISEVTKGKHRVLIVSPNGALRLSFGQEGASLGQFSYPNGIAFDGQGRIVVSDSNNGRVVVFDGAGHPLWSFGRDSGSSLGLPRGLASDGGKRLYVVDAVSHDVLGYDLGDQSMQQVFTMGGQGDGSGQFSFPNGVAVDRTGRIYVTDRENQRVQVWTN